MMRRGTTSSAYEAAGLEWRHVPVESAARRGEALEELLPLLRARAAARAAPWPSTATATRTSWRRSARRTARGARRRTRPRASRARPRRGSTVTPEGVRAAWACEPVDVGAATRRSSAGSSVEATQRSARSSATATGWGSRLLVLAVAAVRSAPAPRRGPPRRPRRPGRSRRGRRPPACGPRRAGRAPSGTAAARACPRSRPCARWPSPPPPGSRRCRARGRPASDRWGRGGGQEVGAAPDGQDRVAEVVVDELRRCRPTTTTSARDARSVPLSTAGRRRPRACCSGGRADHERGLRPCASRPAGAACAPPTVTTSRSEAWTPIPQSAAT